MWGKSRLTEMLLAGDIGGTKTLLGLFDSAPARPRATLVRSYGTLDYDDLETMIATFLKDGHAMPGGIDPSAAGDVDASRRGARKATDKS